MPKDNAFIAKLVKALLDEKYNVQVDTPEEFISRTRFVHESKLGLATPFMGMPFHWFFWAALDCYSGPASFLPTISCLINGIEGSIRCVEAIENNLNPVTDIHKTRSLDNPQMKKMAGYGIDISVFSFSSEGDFAERLNKTDGGSKIKLVALRNALNHGNLNEFIQKPPELQDEEIFVPEFLEDTFREVLLIAYNWAEEYGKWRKAKGL